MEQHANPPQPDPPSESTVIEIDPSAIIIMVICLIACVGLTVYYTNIQSKRQCMFINNPVTISTFDEEFDKFIGASHTISEYNYIEYRLSGNSEIGYGPLFTFANLQIIVGKTGSVAAISYGTCKGRTWSIHGDKQDGDQTVILVLKDCVVPQAWWNHMLTSTVSRNVPLPDGRALPIAQLWTPLSDDATPDDSILEATFASSPWYWDGDSYVEASFSDTTECTLFRPSSRGIFLFLLYSYLGLMEAAEGGTVVPIVVVRRVDGGGIEAQVVSVRCRRVRRLRPIIRVEAGIVQCGTADMVVARTGIPQRRKGNS